MLCLACPTQETTCQLGRSPASIANFFAIADFNIRRPSLFFSKEEARTDSDESLTG